MAWVCHGQPPLGKRRRAVQQGHRRYSYPRLRRVHPNLITPLVGILTDLFQPPETGPLLGFPSRSPFRFRLGHRHPPFLKAR